MNVNIGRNYWSFDTVMAATWFNAETGTELSVIPGLMMNTENPDTNYRTGTEFHVDAVANQFLSETFAVGVVALCLQANRRRFRGWRDSR